jgi:hypothetical protein
MNEAEERLRYRQMLSDMIIRILSDDNEWTITDLWIEVRNRQEPRDTIGVVGNTVASLVAKGQVEQKETGIDGWYLYKLVKVATDD